MACRRFPPIASLLALALTVATAAALGGLLCREAGRIASLWIANGVLVAVLLCAPRRHWPAYLAAGAAANLGVNLALGDALPAGIGLTLCNTVEILIAARWLPPQPDLTLPRTLVRFLGLGAVVAPAVSAILAAALLSAGRGAPFTAALRWWFAADALGMAVTVPLVLNLLGGHLKPMLRPGHAWRTIALLLAFVATTTAIFAQSRYPLLFLAFPMLLLVTANLGVSGASLAVFLLAVIALSFTIAGSGPFTLKPGVALSEKIITAQGFLCVGLLMSLAVGAILAERSRAYEALRSQKRRLQQSEAKLRISEAHYRALTECAGDMIVRTRSDRTRAYVSPAAHALLGFTPAELLELDFAGFLHPEDRERVETAYSEFRRRGGRTTCSYRLRHKDGSYVWVESAWVAVAPESGSGNGVEVVAIVRDVSERKAAETLLAAALARAEAAERQAARDQARLADAIEVIPAGFILFDAEHRLVTCNSKYRDLYDRTADLLTPGVSAADLVRIGVERGQYEIGGAAPGAWAEARLLRHYGEMGRHEQRLGDGRWIQVEERRTAEGGIVGIRVDITAAKRREADLAAARDAAEVASSELAHLAATDALTGLANRRQLDLALEAEWKRALRDRTCLALILLDVDCFKAYNDRYGHQQGDSVLRRVAACLDASIRRPGDLAARYGGEEFAALLPATGIEGAMQVAEQARGHVMALAAEHPGSVHGMLTASLGVAAIVPTHAATPASLLEAADKALYIAKRAGRNRCEAQLGAAVSALAE